MSLIFDALKRKRSRADSDAAPPGQPLSRRNRQDWRNIVFSPVGILVTAAVIFFSGLLVAHGVQSFSAGPAPQPQAATGSVPRFRTYAPQPGPDEPWNDSASDEMAAPAAPLWQQNQETGGLEPGSPDGQAGADEETGRLDTMPAAADGEPSPAPIPAESTNSAILESQENPYFEQFAPTRDMQPPTATGPGNIMAMAGAANHLAAVRNAAVNRPSVVPRADDHQPAISAGKSAPAPRNNGRFQEHLQTGRLADRIMNAIHLDDHTLAARLLAELEELKGPDHLFVLKLKAYWMIRQDRLDKARALLSQALVLRPDDFETGLNMAVVDIRDGRHDQARSRLDRLQVLYPEERVIGGYLLQLGAQPGR